MRKFIVAATAAAIASAALAVPVKAEDTTTVIRKDDGFGDQKTIIKKHEDRSYIAPREEKKVIIHRD